MSFKNVLLVGPTLPILRDIGILVDFKISFAVIIFLLRFKSEHSVENLP